MSERDRGPVRTSETSPLWINELPLGGGLVDMTICPGKTCSAPPHQGSATDTLR